MDTFAIIYSVFHSVVEWCTSNKMVDCKCSALNGSIRQPCRGFGTGFRQCKLCFMFYFSLIVGFRLCKYNEEIMVVTIYQYYRWGSKSILDESYWCLSSGWRFKFFGPNISTIGFISDQTPSGQNLYNPLVDDQIPFFMSYLFAWLPYKALCDFEFCYSEFGKGLHNLKMMMIMIILNQLNIVMVVYYIVNMKTCWCLHVVQPHRAAGVAVDSC